MFFIALQLFFVYETYEGISVVSLLAFTLLTPGHGAVPVTKDHKKSAALWDPRARKKGDHGLMDKAL
jgi:hypothetical protein